MLCAGMVRPGKPIVDVGTDHGYLPAYLLENKIIDYAYLSDLREGPLENAKQTLMREGLTGQAETVLSDGLAAFSPGFCHDFVFAGMGGNLIADLLSESPWVNEVGNHFVLQPQSHAEDLREYLYNSGFEILREDMAKEGKRLYLAMEVVYTGKICTHKSLDYFVGEVKNSRSDCKVEYLNSTIKRLEIRRNALESSEALKRKNAGEIEAINNVVTGIKEVLACQK